MGLFDNAAGRTPLLRGGSPYHRLSILDETCSCRELQHEVTTHRRRTGRVRVRADGSWNGAERRAR